MEGGNADFTGFVVSVLQGYGLAGLLLLAMALVIRALWQDNVKLRDTLFDVGRQSIEANNATTNALNLLSAKLDGGRARNE